MVKIKTFKDISNYKNIILDKGEVAYSRTRQLQQLPCMKIGDGKSKAKNLPYIIENKSLYTILRQITVIENNKNLIHYIDNNNGNEYYIEFDDNGKIIHYRDSGNYEIWYDLEHNKHRVKEG